MNDLVILRGDSVVDAIFRSPERHYTGVSSSPEQIAPRTSTKPKAKRSKSAATPAPKIKPPKEANDARPSIPVNPTPMKPAPNKPPATTKPGQPT
jgi:hypothetical protein